MKMKTKQFIQVIIFLLLVQIAQYSGRYSSSNYQIGFVDICDKPYPETIAASRKIGYQMYKVRYEN